LIFIKPQRVKGLSQLSGGSLSAARGMSDRDSKLDRSSFHLLLLAENETVIRNLLKISSAAQLDGFSIITLASIGNFLSGSL
jgi:DNA polymerase-3 subunit alpha